MKITYALAALALLLAVPATFAIAQDNTSASACDMPDSEAIIVNYVSPLNFYIPPRDPSDPSITWREVNDAVASSESMGSMVSSGKPMDMPPDGVPVRTEPAIPQDKMTMPAKTRRRSDTSAKPGTTGAMPGMTMPGDGTDPVKEKKESQ